MSSANNHNENEKSLRREQALSRCSDLAGWYEAAKRRNRIAYQASQVATVALSGATPILILWSDAPEVVQALPAALVTMIVGMSGIFQWKENYIRPASRCRTDGLRSGSRCAPFTPRMRRLVRSSTSVPRELFLKWSSS